MTDDLDPSLRGLFAAGPGAEPPLGLTPAAVLASGRAARRRRRGGLAAGGAGLSVVAVVAAVTVTSLAGGSPAVPAAAGGDCRTAAPTPRPTGDPAVSPTPRPTGAPAVTPTPRPTGDPGVSPPGTSVPVTPPPPRRTDDPAITPPAPRATADPSVPPTPKPTSQPTRFARSGLVPVTPRATIEVSPAPTCAPTPAPTAAPRSPESADVPPRTEAARLAWLTARLKRTLPIPPDAQLTASTEGGRLPLSFFPSDGGYKAAADVRDPAGRAGIEITIRRDAPPAAGDPCDGGLKDCVSSRRPNGDLVFSHRYTEGTGTAWMAQAYRTDGTTLFISVTDFSLNDLPGTAAPRSQRPTPLYTRAQLTAFVLNRTLHL